MIEVTVDGEGIKVCDDGKVVIHFSSPDEAEQTGKELLIAAQFAAIHWTKRKKK